MLKCVKNISCLQSANADVNEGGSRVFVSRFQ